MQFKAIPAVFLKLVLALVLAGPALADRAYSVPPGINVLSTTSKVIGAYVKNHYPVARTHAFVDLIHFEHATSLHVLPAISKNAKPPMVAERGPLAGGVWCDIEVKNGGIDKAAAYARAEGAIDRKAFMEYRYYLAPPHEPHHHLIVTLRLPRDAGGKGEQFLEGLKKALEEFRIERQTLRQPE
ncbi:MAG: hypothetical protein HKN82_01400 [Akkermansiaceae bacterium]|nr:hypothetical protein [Akkermansiaceae bacterium]